MTAGWWDENQSAATAAKLRGYQVITCNCVGPQPGQPVCPCKMLNLIQRDGRWIRPEQDLGPVSAKDLRDDR